jgi:hypothetical protein
VKGRRELFAANGVGLLVLLVVLWLGWREEAVFGLVVLVIMDLLVIVRERFVRYKEDLEE